MNPKDDIRLSSTFSNELFNQSFDMGVDYLEIGLDNFFTDGVIQQIPIVKSMHSLFKIFGSIREFDLTKKLLAFVKAVNSGTIDTEKLEEYKSRFYKDKHFRDKQIEHIIVILDRVSEAKKALVLANLYRGYIEQIYTWDKFVELSYCLESAFLSDIDLLKFLFGLNAARFHDSGDKTIAIGEIVLENFEFDDKFVSVNRLNSSGLLIINSTSKTWGELADPYLQTVKVSGLGILFYRYGGIALYQQFAED